MKEYIFRVEFVLGLHFVLVIFHLFPDRSGGSARDADLINSSTFALQDDDLQQLGGVTLGVFPGVSRQDLHQRVPGGSG